MITIGIVKHYNKKMKVAVIGTGYVGLVTGVCLSREGHDITCYDIDSDIIKNVNDGNPHFFEKGLNRRLRESLTSGYFKARIIDWESIFCNELHHVRVKLIYHILKLLLKI